jgi:hypothetical protein
MALNPFKGMNQLTAAEVVFVANLTGLTYAQGDILYYNGTNLTNLGIGSPGEVLTVNGGGTAPDWVAGAGSGTVTDVSVVTANGVSGSVATSTTTPAITLTLGDITPSSVVATGAIESKTSFILEEPGAGVDTITIVAPASLFSGSYTLTLPVSAGGSGYVLSTDGAGVLSWIPAGTGTVTDVSVVTANGISGSVATSTTTPAITLTLGVITPTSVNGLTLAAQAIGFTIAGGTTPKTLTVPLDASVSGTNTGDQTITLSGAVTGTGTAGITTVMNSNIIDLLDVTIAAPAVDQFLRYNGAEWVNSPIGNVSAGAATVFFNDDTAIIATSTNNAIEINTLSKIPAGGAEVVDTLVVNSNTLIFEAYLYNTALGVVSIPAGVWEFDTYAGVSASAGFA